MIYILLPILSPITNQSFLPLLHPNMAITDNHINEDNEDNECNVCKEPQELMMKCDRCVYYLCMDCRQRVDKCPFCRLPFSENQERSPLLSEEEYDRIRIVNANVLRIVRGIVSFPMPDSPSTTRRRRRSSSSPNVSSPPPDNPQLFRQTAAIFSTDDDNSLT